MSGTTLFSDYFRTVKKKSCTTPQKDQSWSNKENISSTSGINDGKLFTAVFSVQNNRMRSPSSTTNKHLTKADSNSLNLSHSRKKLDFSREERSQSPFKARKMPTFEIPFTVYKSTRPLTIPQEPNLTSRTEKKAGRPKQETPEEILERLREKAKHKIITKDTKSMGAIGLLNQFKEKYFNEINSVMNEVQNSRFEDVKQSQTFKKLF